MHAIPVSPTVDCARELPMADFRDAFAIDVESADLDAPEAARRAFSRQPGWIDGLLALRNLAMAPFGLKTGADPKLPPGKRYGIFPVVSSTPERVVLGFDDRHLDFRIVIDVNTVSPRMRRVTATTLVHRNNAFGHAYLAAIMPFHKRIVPAILAGVGTH